ncbi:hypothetical protein LIER_05067 [Lithospermum erythrorhizon]|uniref:Uncharacterized protein n=1 Tax=Lithospermum erythrorhizon TaxID=34254 RepID=A0AAV3NZ44_LITER
MAQEEKSTMSKSNFSHNNANPTQHAQSKIIELDHQTSNDFFEFYSDQSFEMSHAEDIFLGGKLLPLQQQQQPHSSLASDNMLKAFHQRRCESLSDQKTSNQWNTSPRRLRRNSKSLDYRNVNILYDTSPNNDNGVRGLSQNRSPNKRKSDYVGELKVSKPRWYIMLFGLLAKIPHQEMDLQDIKIRQTRRKPPFEGIQNETSKSSWGMLNVLSCKSSASIAVASSGSHILG